MLKILKDKYFWIVAALVAFTGIVYYAPDVPSLQWLAFDEHLGITRRAFARALFLFPIFFAAWKFGFKGGFVCSVAFVIIVIQRIIVTPWRPDAIAETIIIFCIGIVISWLIDSMEKARMRQQAISNDLNEANIRLQEMDRLKSVFLASMSHELRTPLNSIIGFTGIMLMDMAGELNDEQRRQLTMVKNSASHLLSLINDVLDISKIEAGKIEILLEEFSLDDIVREVIEYITPMAAAKRLEVTAELSKGVVIYSDRRRVKQVLINLMSNAVKFTEQGSVKLNGFLQEDGVLKISVIDTGRGIKQEDISKLFQPFQRIDMSASKSYTEGTGLGLYLTRNIADLLKGDIRATSEYGKGSVFIFTLPIKYEGECGDEDSSDN
ncbi:MAG: sensor histidine kinase [Peptococcaceae bacterium]